MRKCASTQCQHDPSQSICPHIHTEQGHGVFPISLRHQIALLICQGQPAYGMSASDNGLLISSCRPCDAIYRKKGQRTHNIYYSISEKQSGTHGNCYLFSPLASLRSSIDLCPLLSLQKSHAYWPSLKQGSVVGSTLPALHHQASLQRLTFIALQSN